MNIIYLRVSTNEDRQDLEQQLKAILSKYKLKEYKVLMDEGSAYDQAKIGKRTDFLKLIEILFDAENISIKDLYLRNFEKSNHKVYVWDYSRIMRNLELNVQFYLLAMHFNVSIISHKDNQLFEIKEEDVELDLSKRFLSLMNYMILSFSAEAYSRDTSKNINRSFIKETSSSTYGIYLGSLKPIENWAEHWSSTLVDLKGKERNRLTPQGKLTLLLSEFQEFLAYVGKLLSGSCMRGEVIEIVKREKGIKLSHSWFSKHFKGK